MTEHNNGILIKGIGGFYYVEVADTVYTCKARGTLRKQGLSPIAGDHVNITVQADGTGTIESILPRRNFLLRPPIANIAYLVIVVSVTEPAPNLQVIDKMIALAEQHAIEPILLINKTDLSSGDDLVSLYCKAGFPCFAVSAQTPSSLLPFRQMIAGKVVAFTGNSGVGKSSILNALEPSLTLQTGEISKKLGRGRHTTRYAALFHVGSGYIVDTPGFSSIDMDILGDDLDCEQLFFCFREFGKHFGRCRFSSCTHTKEPGCAIKQAVENGEIAASRYESYCVLYEQFKHKKEWE